ncbi:MAG: undecaprenyl-diphosphate phosphatase [Planctomycetes bacterium]|nr:undecaprenyl-diphosphate phosphatase [Planctomycetota bacterium]
MSFFELAILAVVQGLTEFLPVSSSGHLVLSRELLHIELENPLVVDIALHVGTLLAVFWVYRTDVLGILRSLPRLPRWRKGAGDPELDLLARLFVASLPAAILGVLCKDWIEANMMSLVPVACALLVTAGFLFLGDRASRTVTGRDELPGYGVAFAIGCAQAVALCPGCSRSGWTIAMALLFGLSGTKAARLSFLMMLIAVGGAALLQLKDVLQGHVKNTIPVLDLVLAMGLAALTGYLACRLLLLVLRRGSLRWFALYCALVGSTALVVSRF